MAVLGIQEQEEKASPNMQVLYKSLLIVPLTKEVT